MDLTIDFGIRRAVGEGLTARQEQTCVNRDGEIDQNIVITLKYMRMHIQLTLTHSYSRIVTLSTSAPCTTTGDGCYCFLFIFHVFHCLFSSC